MDKCSWRIPWLTKERFSGNWMNGLVETYIQQWVRHSNEPVVDGWSTHAYQNNTRKACLHMELHLAFSLADGRTKVNGIAISHPPKVWANRRICLNSEHRVCALLPPVCRADHRIPIPKGLGWLPSRLAPETEAKAAVGTKGKLSAEFDGRGRCKVHRSGWLGRWGLGEGGRCVRRRGRRRAARPAGEGDCIRRRSDGFGLASPDGTVARPLATEHKMEDREQSWSL